MSIIPLPDHLAHCGCPGAPNCHRRTCVPAREHDATPLREREGYAPRQRFAAITWDWPMRMSATYRVEVALDPFEVIRARIDDYRAWEPGPDDGPVDEPWEKPIMYLSHLVAEQIDFPGVAFHDPVTRQRLSDDRSYLDELTDDWRWDRAKCMELLERIEAIPVPPLVDPNQQTLDVAAPPDRQDG